MTAARNKFYDTISVIRGLTSEPIAIDALPAGDLHNIKAKIIRSSLVVAAFSHLETYIEERLEEVLPVLATTKISFANFEDRMKRFFSVSAIDGISRRIGFLEKNDALVFAESQLTRIASFKSIPPVFTSFGFNPNSSNVSPKDISELLKAFGVTDSWRKMGGLCAKVGAARLNLQDDFQNLVRTRNKAAHDSGANIPTGDLVTHIETAMLVGLSVDFALTHAIRCHVQASNANAAKNAADALNLRMRFLDSVANGTYREIAAGAARAYRVHVDLIAASNSRSRPYQGFVVRDLRLFPMRIL